MQKKITPISTFIDSQSLVRCSKFVRGDSQTRTDNYMHKYIKKHAYTQAHTYFTQAEADFDERLGGVKMQELRSVGTRDMLPLQTR